MNKVHDVLMTIKDNKWYRMMMIILFIWAMSAMVRSCNTDNGIYILGETIEFQDTDKEQGTFLAGEVITLNGVVDDQALRTMLEEAIVLRHHLYPETITITSSKPGASDTAAVIPLPIGQARREPSDS
jgi:hypothetical protein